MKKALQPITSKWTALPRSWKYVLLFLTAILIVLGVCLYKGTLTGAQFLDIFLIAALVIVTTQLAALTRRMADEMKQQRFDASRPVLISAGGRTGIAASDQVITLLDYEDDWLHLRNIGSGPALNVTIAIEDRRPASLITYLDRNQAEIQPVPAGGSAVVYQSKITAGYLRIQPDYWIAINYTDLYGNPFRTESRYGGYANNWVDVTIM